MSRKYAKALEQLAALLRHAQRMGAEIDSPEGTRYLQISDTLALKWAHCLETIAENLTLGTPKPEIPKTGVDQDYPLG